MLRFRRSYFSGVQDFFFVHGFRQLALYSTSISTEVNPNFVNYLVDNLGFSRKQALSTTSKFTYNRQIRGAKEVSDFELIKNSTSVIEFFKEFGLQHSHIQNVIAFNPQILMSNVEQILASKTDALRKLGFSETDIAEVISVNPALLLAGLNTTIIPAIEALREIMGGSEGHVISVLKKLRCINLKVIPKYLVSNVALLRGYGIPLGSIRKNLLWNPYVFVRTTDVLKNGLIRVEKKLGIPRNSPHFLSGVTRVICMTDKTIESKLQVYKSFGWTDPVIATHISSNPMVLSKSNDNIKKKLDFLMNEMGYKPNYLATKVNLFTCSLEKRIVPRHKVLVVLKENGLMTGYSLPTVVTYSDSRFLNKFVLPFKEVHEVYSKFAGINLKMLTLGSSKPNSSSL